MTALTLAQLAEITGGEIHGNESTLISAVAPMNSAGEGQITFLTNVK